MFAALVFLSQGDFENLGFLAPNLSDPIEQVTGKRIIAEDALSISDLPVRIGQSQAGLHGTLPWGETTHFRDGELRANVAAGDVRKFQPEERESISTDE